MHDTPNQVDLKRVIFKNNGSAPGQSHHRRNRQWHSNRKLTRATWNSISIINAHKDFKLRTTRMMRMRATKLNCWLIAWRVRPKWLYMWNLRRMRMPARNINYRLAALSKRQWRLWTNSHTKSYEKRQSLVDNTYLQRKIYPPVIRHQS